MHYLQLSDLCSLKRLHHLPMTVTSLFPSFLSSPLHIPSLRQLIPRIQAQLYRQRIEGSGEYAESERALALDFIPPRQGALVGTLQPHLPVHTRRYTPVWLRGDGTTSLWFQQRATLLTPSKQNGSLGLRLPHSICVISYSLPAGQIAPLLEQTHNW